MALLLTPLQIFLGDQHGLNTVRYQPVKAAAIEGDWETMRGQPLDPVLAGPTWPRAQRLGAAIPKLGSLILTHEWNGLVQGLKSVPPDERPYVPVVFWAFRPLRHAVVRARLRPVVSATFGTGRFASARASRGFARVSWSAPSIVTFAFIVLVSLWTPVAHARIAHRWFHWPLIAFFWPVPILTALLARGIWREIGGDRDKRPFLLSVALFLLAFLGLGISLWPYAAPYQATLWQAAASAPTLAFVGNGVAIALPVVIAYFAWAHWIFRGKIEPGTGYSE